MIFLVTVSEQDFNILFICEKNERRNSPTHVERQNGGHLGTIFDHLGHIFFYVACFGVVYDMTWLLQSLKLSSSQWNGSKYQLNP